MRLAQARGGGKGWDRDEKKPTRCLKGTGLPAGCVCFQGEEGGGTAEQVIAVTTPPPNTQPPLPLFLCEEIYFFPCHAILDSLCCGRINQETATLSKPAYFFSCSVAPVPDLGHEIRSGCRLRSTWL
ncbi:uncharacterized [Tachysurus ichikawai]